MPKIISNRGFLNFVYVFHKGIKEHGIILAYEGEINQQLMKTFTGMVKVKMSKSGEPESLQKKVYHIMVECLQNIIKHAVNPADANDPDNRKGVFLISRKEELYRLTTGNIIDNEKISFLTGQLSHINSLYGKQLDELYKKQLKEGRLSEEGGAGLGFIDIRRKTGIKLEYKFLPVSETKAFFMFTSAIPRNI